MKKKKGNFTTLLLILVLLAGLSLLLYPSLSDYWNSFHQTRAIATYAEKVANLNQDQYDEIWAAAESYNASLTDRVNAYLLSERPEGRIPAAFECVRSWRHGLY